jgi:hypothetical protein
VKEQELEIFFVILKDSHSLTKLKNFAESLGWTDYKLNMGSLYEFVLVFNAKRNGVTLPIGGFTRAFLIGIDHTYEKTFDLSKIDLIDQRIPSDLIEEIMKLNQRKTKKIREFL